MTEPIDRWKYEFEQFYASINDGFCPNQYDGQYDWFDAQNCWLSFLAAKRRQPVVELPDMFRDYYLGRQSYDAENVHERLTAAGINYRIKGE